MTRGVAHPDELRAQVIAMVVAGTSITEAALHFNLDKGLISRWVHAAGLQLVATKKVDSDTELIMGYFRAALRAMTSQAEVFGDPVYCRGQDADKLAIAHGVLGDKLVGISETAQALGLIALAPDARPAFELGSADSAPGPSDDDR